MHLMFLKKGCYAFVVFFCLAACHNAQRSIDKVQKRKFLDPSGSLSFTTGQFNLINIAGDSLFYDATEIANVHWRQYLYNLRNRFPNDAEIFMGAMPDSSVWRLASPCLAELSKYYLGHKDLLNYPVVGVSQEQARAYAEWRTNAAFQNMLIQNGIIELRPFTGPDPHFTVEKFFRGEVPRVRKKVKITHYLSFRLPTYEERLLALARADSLERFQRQINNANCRHSFPDIRSDGEPCLTRSKYDFPIVHVDSSFCNFKINILRIYHLRGNVSEWLAEDGMAAGGSWNDTRQEIMETDAVVNTGANAWTGFRCVASWKRWEEE